MKTLLITLTILMLTGCATTHEPYFKTGISYIAAETQLQWKRGVDNSEINKIVCRFELGMENKEWSYGARHFSQCFIGAPFNSKEEFSREELFLDYKYKF